MSLPDPMLLAIEKAWEFQGLTYPNPAVGACVVDRYGRILSVQAHQKAGGPHAEVLALQQAFIYFNPKSTMPECDRSVKIHDFLLQNHHGCFQNCTIYITLEPCAHHGKTPACANLLAQLEIARVVYACADPHAIAAGGGALLRHNGIDVVHAPCREADELLLPFVRWQEDRFMLFKWAQRLDGSVDSGVISSEISRRRVHAMRSAADLLIIGGQTVRTDRPTLDARMVDGAAPDILIYSRQKTFDTSIPLFAVAGRKVEIASTLEVMNEYKNILVEGGPAMFASIKDFCDMYLCFVAPKWGGTIYFSSDEQQFEIRHLARSGGDVMQWMVNG